MNHKLKIEHYEQRIRYLKKRKKKKRKEINNEKEQKTIICEQEYSCDLNACNLCQKQSS